MPWTEFWDMHSGGGTKEGDCEQIFIEAPLDEATSVFYAKFGHNPERVSCTCCGEDYSITEYKSLEQATAFHRGCKYDDKLRQYVEVADPDGFKNSYKTVEQYKKEKTALFIYADEIKPEERTVDVPDQGYVYID